MSHWNPIRRSPLKPKPRLHKESWRSGRVRLNAQEMRQLRQEAFARSAGQCENSADGRRCATRINWSSFHLAHIVSRGRGGSDVVSNVLACCPECHWDSHHGRARLEPHQDWIAAA